MITAAILQPIADIVDDLTDRWRSLPPELLEVRRLERALRRAARRESRLVRRLVRARHPAARAALVGELARLREDMRSKRSRLDAASYALSAGRW